MAIKLFINDQEHGEISVIHVEPPRQGPPMRIPVLGGASLTAPGRSYPGTIKFKTAQWVSLSPRDSYELRDDDGSSLVIQPHKINFDASGVVIDAIYQ